MRTDYLMPRAIPIVTTEDSGVMTMPWQCPWVEPKEMPKLSRYGSGHYGGDLLASLKKEIV